MNFVLITPYPLMKFALSTMLRKQFINADIVGLNQIEDVVNVRIHPDLIIIDHPNIFEPKFVFLASQLRQIQPTSKIVVLTESNKILTNESSCLIGIDAILLKTELINNISQTINNLIDIKKPHKPTLSVKLTKRQKQIYLLVEDGLSNDDIADRLDISAHTVKVHLWRLYRKLNIKSRTQLISLMKTCDFM